MTHIKKATIVLSICVATSLNANILNNVSSSVTSGVTGAIKDTISNSVGNLIGGVGDKLNGSINSFLGTDFNDMIKGKTETFSSDYLQAQCTIPNININGSLGICGRLTGGFVGFLNSLLGQKLNLFGMCQIGTSARICNDNLLKKMCDAANNKAQEVIVIINDSVNSDIDGAMEKVRTSVEDAMSITNRVYSSSDTYKQNFPTTADKQSNPDQCFLGSDYDQKNIFGEKISEKDDVASQVADVLSGSEEGVGAANEYIMRCMRQIPTRELNENNIDKYIQFCSPRNFTGSSYKDTKQQEREAAAKLSANTAPTTAQVTENIKQQANDKLNACLGVKTLQEKNACEKNFLKSQSATAKKIAADKAVDSTSAQEYYSTLADMLLTHNYTKEKLEKIPSNKRAYAALQSLKERERNVLILANLQKIQKLREELGALSAKYEKVCANQEADSAIYDVINAETINKANMAAMAEATKKANEAKSAASGSSSSSSGAGSKLP